MGSFIQQERTEFFNLFRRVKKKDFEGNEGIVIKNSIYQFSTTLTGKLGGFLITILLARLLLPELFGLYSLVLSTVFVFIGFTELGLGETMIRMVSKKLSNKEDGKAKGYVFYLIKIKIFLVLIFSIILILSAKFIANNYYNKPIYFGLIAGSIFLIFFTLTNFFEDLIHSVNKFKLTFISQVFLQFFRVAFVSLSALLIINSSLSKDSSIFIIMLGLSAAYLFTLVFMAILSKKKLNFLNAKKVSLTKEEKNKTIKFLIPLSTIILSGAFFGYIDVIILGHFVLSESIGYYDAAWKLIGSIAPLISFSIVLLPIFSNLSGQRLENAFKKTLKIVFLLSLAISLFTFIFAPLIIKIVFGEEYATSILLLRILSPLLLNLPIVQIYTSYLISIGRPKVLAWLLIFSTLMNIGLNYLLISQLLSRGQIWGVVGAAIATIVSRYFLLGMMMIYKKKIVSKFKN